MNIDSGKVYYNKGTNEERLKKANKELKTIRRGIRNGKK